MSVCEREVAGGVYERQEASVELLARLDISSIKLRTPKTKHNQRNYFKTKPTNDNDRNPPS